MAHEGLYSCHSSCNSRQGLRFQGSRIEGLLNYAESR